MIYLLHKSRLQHLISHRNGYLALASGSLLLNMLLALAMFAVAGHERIVVVPPSINKSFWVTDNQVSPEYLYDMTLYFAVLRFNLTASNVAEQHDRLLHYINPNGYAEVKTQLQSEAEHLTKAHIAMSFYLVDLDVDAKNLVTVITGDVQGIVGTSVLPLERVTYRLTFTYHGGRLLVKSFDEVKAHA